MPKIRHIDFYPDEWIAAVAGMPADMQGVYWLICSLIYSSNGPLQDDDPRLHALCGCHGRTLNAIIAKLEKSAKIVRNDAEIDVKRCRKELEKALNRSAKAVENGAKGGRPSKENNEIEKPGGFPSENPSRARTTNLPTTNHKESPSDEGRQSDRRIALAMVEEWNRILVPPLAKPTQLSQKRIVASRARLHGQFNGDLAQWTKFLERVRGSPFLLGNNNRGWKADYDFCTTESKVLAVIEGKYDGQSNGNGHDVSERQRPQGPAPALPEGWERNLQLVKPLRS